MSKEGWVSLWLNCNRNQNRIPEIRLTGDANAAAVGAGTAVGTGFGRDITVRVAFAAGTFAAGVGAGAAVRTGFGSHVTVRIGLAGGALAAAVGVGAAVRAGQ